jgi:hypothetical protein
MSRRAVMALLLLLPATARADGNFALTSRSARPTGRW